MAFVALQRFDSPVLDLVDFDVEAGFVDLDRIAARLGERAGLAVQDPGIVHRERGVGPAAVVVDHAVGQSHRARQRYLDRPVGAGAGERQRVGHHRPGP